MLPGLRDGLTTFGPLTVTDVRDLGREKDESRCLGERAVSAARQGEICRALGLEYLTVLAR